MVSPCTSLETKLTHTGENTIDPTENLPQTINVDQTGRK